MTKNVLEQGSDVEKELMSQISESVIEEGQPNELVSQDVTEIKRLLKLVQKSDNKVVKKSAGIIEKELGNILKAVKSIDRGI